MYYQRTIKYSVSCQGIGLHTGQKTKLTLKPAPPNMGIIFHRLDLADRPIIEASYKNLRSTSYATSLAKDGVEVYTIEHLMAAFAGLGVDNVIVELDSSEVPIMDGSAAPFVSLLEEAELQIQDNPRTYIQIEKPIKVTNGNGSFVSIHPADEFRITYSLHYGHPLLMHQEASVLCSKESFVDKIGNARTFGFLDELDHLRRLGLVRGGSLSCAVVLGEDEIINEDGLRFEEEFVYHKIMDSMGDFYLLGRPILGHIVAHKAGHALHAELTKKIASRTDHWSLVSRKTEITTTYPANNPYNEVLPAAAY